MIYVENRKRKFDRIQADYPNAIILDITSNSTARYAQILSPFYPHYNIPVPFTDGMTAACVEGIWQGLKVFKNADVDRSTLNNDTMKNIKRTVRRFGAPLGHRKGVYGTELLNYFEARMLIYLPTYKWILDNVPEVHKVVMRIKEKAKDTDIVLLDYNTNTDFRDISKPISHAGLVKAYIEDNYPDSSKNYEPMSLEELEEKKNRLKALKKNSKQKSTGIEESKEKGLFD
ncbi:MAG: hypothetical protein NC335_07920 [Bacteroides sp.]|nr:hypothetical protein [Bacteroides sp.]